MAGKLAAEIRQQKPFEHIEEEATLNLVRTAEMLNQKATEFFRQFDLSRTQYNVLRILRGAGEDGLTCSATAERMVSRDPDITRLMDRMETQRTDCTRTHVERSANRADQAHKGRPATGGSLDGACRSSMSSCSAGLA